MSITISGSSGIVGANGSASLPALTGGDPDTGIFFPAANVVAFSTGSVESFRANANGIFATANVNVTNLTATNLTATNVIPTSSFLRNRIINGDMRIDQRNAGASVAGSTSNPYTVDRWQSVSSLNSKYTIQQNAASVTPPTGYINYLGATSSSAYSVLTGDYFALQQIIEGLNVADLAWGTASAATVTLSFWVRSSLTGTFGGSLTNNGSTRSYPFTYTISSANTWEQKSITIAGDTTGTWLTTNGVGIRVGFSLGVGATYSGTAGAWAATNYISATGATSVVGTSGATFYITGVQLEVGSVATPFERRLYGQELALCQRYYYRNTAPSTGTLLTTSGITQSATSAIAMTQFPVAMRASPTALEQSGTAAHYQVFISSNVACSAVPTFLAANVWYATTTATAASGLGGNLPCWITAANTAAYLGWSAEL